MDNIYSISSWMTGYAYGPSGSPPVPRYMENCVQSVRKPPLNVAVSKPHTRLTVDELLRVGFESIAPVVNRDPGPELMFDNITTNLLATSQVGKPGFIGLVGARGVHDSCPQRRQRKSVTCALKAHRTDPVGREDNL